MIGNWQRLTRIWCVVLVMCVKSDSGQSIKWKWGKNWCKKPSKVSKIQRKFHLVYARFSGGKKRHEKPSHLQQASAAKSKNTEKSSLKSESLNGNNQSLPEALSSSSYACNAGAEIALENSNLRCEQQSVKSHRVGGGRCREWDRSSCNESMDDEWDSFARISGWNSAGGVNREEKLTHFSTSREFFWLKNMPEIHEKLKEWSGWGLIKEDFWAI